ncbi:MAG TPA: hypothetical protein VEJ47_15825 [Candidatus Eremiobacteraceae bacterium]|nr:hypothetical protein [Candidatus Eremiobacteraceae bacterium]
MKPLGLVAISVLFFASTSLWADTVILRDGASYSGQFMPANSGQIDFTDGQGVQYNFPISDLQSLVFSRGQDIVTLRNGKLYSGQYNGPDYIAFRDGMGIDYKFPLRDVETIVFTPTASPASASSGVARVIPRGTEIVVHTDESIDSDSSYTGQLFSASVSEDVPDSSGGIAIPRGTRAKLVVRNITSGGAVHSPELALDLFSVDVAGKEYRVDTSDVDLNSGRGIGGNKRTLEYGGAGAGFGSLMGAIFGGGRGAGIGAAAGAGAGLLTQIFTRGKTVKVAAETTMRFRLDRTLVLKLKTQTT